MYRDDRSVCWRHVLNIQSRTEWIVADDCIRAEYEQPSKVRQQAHVPTLIHPTVLHEHNRQQFTTYSIQRYAIQVNRYRTILHVFNLRLVAV